jgi:hypothetical protein
MVDGTDITCPYRPKYGRQWHWMALDGKLYFHDHTIFFLVNHVVVRGHPRNCGLKGSYLSVKGMIDG